MLQYQQRPGTITGKEVESYIIKPIQTPNPQTNSEETRT